MGSSGIATSNSIGLEDDGWKTLSQDLAASLLRVCATPRDDERTFSSVALMATPNGQDLYVRNSLFG